MQLMQCEQWHGTSRNLALSPKTFEPFLRTLERTQTVREAGTQTQCNRHTHQQLKTLGIRCWKPRHLWKQAPFISNCNISLFFVSSTSIAPFFFFFFYYWIRRRGDIPITAIHRLAFAVISSVEKGATYVEEKENNKGINTLHSPHTHTSGEE